MKKSMLLFALLVGTAVHAQVPVAANPDHEAMLRSSDPQLAKNKRFVYDFWREVFEAAQMEHAPKYLAEGIRPAIGIHPVKQPVGPLHQ